MEPGDFLFWSIAIAMIVMPMAIVAAFLKTSPHGGKRIAVVAYDVATLLMAVGLVVGPGVHQYADQGIINTDSLLPTVFGLLKAILLIPVAGLLRNFVIFPGRKTSR